MPGPLWQIRRTERLPVHRLPVLLLTSLLLAATDAARAQSLVGIYRDATGVDCTLADDTEGLFEAHVVVKPTQQGVSGVQFSAPVPACFTGTYLADLQVTGTFVIGNSQTGVSVVLGMCSVTPTHVLTIRYYGLGTTPACCRYDVLPDPATQSFVVTDCFFNEETPVAAITQINSDGSCPCGGNQAPYPPHTPAPADQASSISVFSTLAWEASDPDDNLTEFDVYLGTTPAPPLVATGVPGPAYDAGQLSELTQYYWRVVARDGFGAETSSEVWTFTTRLTNSPPTVPQNPVPFDAATDQLLDVSVEWNSFDLDQDPLFFDVYFGATSPPPLVSANQIPSAYSPSGLEFTTTYYWRIVSRDGPGHETGGPLWSFTTRPENYPPAVPALVAPPNTSLDRPVNQQLAWSGSDPDDDPLGYDLYLGASQPPSLVATSLAATTYAPVLGYATQYYWRVTARDDKGAETPGPVWTFTTVANTPPAVPSNPERTGHPLAPVLTWECSDNDGHTLTYDVYFGTDSPPPLAAGDLANPSYAPDTLSHLTQYYWQVLARDSEDAETWGPEWTFTTADSVPTATGRGALRLALAQNQPNPFNPTTTIRYTLPGGSRHVRLVILDVSGEVVRTLVDREQVSGLHAAEWDGRDNRGHPVASGVYIYALIAGSDRLTRKLVLLK